MISQKSAKPQRPDTARVDAAIRQFEANLARDRSDAKSRYNLALLLIDRGRRGEARRHLEAILAATPDFAPAAFALGRMMLDSGDLAAAERLLAAAATAPALAMQARFILADVMERTERRPEAAALLSWIVDRGAPTPGPYIALASLILDVDAPEALRVAEAGLERFPGLAPLLQLRGQTLIRLGRPDAAVVALRQAIAQGAGGETLGHLLAALRGAGLWDDEAEVVARIRKLLARGPKPGETPPTLTALNFPFTGAELRAIATLNAAQTRAKPLPPAPVAAAPGPLVVGYLSPDFRDHPIANVFADVFAAHDPARVRAVAFSLGPDDRSAVRQEFVAAAHPFVDLRGLSDQAAAERIRAEGTHILVDLALYTEFHRNAIPAFRPAPVQVAWLGLPATTGAPWFDDLLADDIVAPPDHADRFSETLVRLPHGYHPARRLGALPPRPARAALGLPEDAVVFGCFNAHLKIDGGTFAAWMEILARVPGSVLWLRSAPSARRERYLAAAAARGIAPERLVFAPRVESLSEHFARLGCADLLLDCLIYGAHTTCLDALRAGVPMLTVLGETFAARVAASILTHAGLPELVLPDRDAFVAEAIRLGTDAEARAALRQRLAVAVPASPVFDPEAQARALEDAFEAIWAKRVGA